MDNKLEKIRHSASHVLAQAVLEFFPDAKLAIGPAIEDGFYYDFDLGSKTFSEDDLGKIEAKMHEIIKQDQKIEHYLRDADASIKYIKSKKQPYKSEMAQDLKAQGEKELSFYKMVNKDGKAKFVDLCAGPHVESTKEIGAVKLLRVAGAYWRGDEKNKMLQRIYGTAFTKQSELDDYLKMLEEAKKRDHRKLGQELDLFHIDEVVGLGLPLWHPKGALLWRIIEDFWYHEHLKVGYNLVRTPHIGNKTLWETSGHWGFYNESMYPPIEASQSLKESQGKEKVKDPETYLLKPMNCPFHLRIYKNRLHSYREFPLRWAECGTVYRFEKKGELSGLTRVRGFTQDDAHIICRADQVEDELGRVIDFILFIYQSFGFKIEDINVYLSVRDPENNKYAGSEEGWKFTEGVLEKVAKQKGLSFQKDIGGAVFYGPKLDFKIKDAIGREWQCSTLQFDFNLPSRFDIKFTNNEGQDEQPYMLHRALFGSFERFIGLLIEHYGGAFPTWLAPVQVQIVTVKDECVEFAKGLANEFSLHGIRVAVDDSNETVGKKIREAESMRVPYMLVIGEKEMASNDLQVRIRGQKEVEQFSKEKFIERLKREIMARN
ncbi:MAG: threonine--tRNA ligase [Candidatus Buchananbacteria bacterium]|nr:threonine--tRNA ligase [Candidatus Buchananbacteria bacterium]